MRPRLLQHWFLQEPHSLGLRPARSFPWCCVLWESPVQTANLPSIPLSLWKPMSALSSEFFPREDHRSSRNQKGHAQFCANKLPKNEMHFFDGISTHEAAGGTWYCGACGWPNEDSCWVTAGAQLFPNVRSRTNTRIKPPASAKPYDGPIPTSHPLKVWLPFCHRLGGFQAFELLLLPINSGVGEPQPLVISDQDGI